MRPVLGLSVSATAVRGVHVGRDAITWAGEASYATLDDLAEVVARLAAELTPAPRVARIALERDVVQLRCIVPAPPVKPGALGQYVALEAPRLFRRNGVPLVTDARLVAAGPETSSLWAAATTEPLVQAVVAGCAQAGLTVEAIGPAADVLAHAVQGGDGERAFPNGGTVEVIAVGPSGAWRSRRVRPIGGQERQLGCAWVPILAGLGDDAPRYAAAFGAAVARPRLALWPADVRATRARTGRRRTLRIAAVGLALWVVATGTYVTRLSWTLHLTTESLDAVTPAVDSALAVRRELGLAQATLAAFAEAERRRSWHLPLLAELTQALDDATYLVGLTVEATGSVRLTGYARSASQARAALEGLGTVRAVRFEGGLTREQVPGTGERERFTIVGQLVRQP